MQGRDAEFMRQCRCGAENDSAESPPRFPGHRRAHTGNALITGYSDFP